MSSRRLLRQSSIPLLAVILLLVSFPSQSQSQDATQENEGKPDSSSLTLMVDKAGSAKVNLWLPIKVEDQTRLRQALAQSLSFPLNFVEPSNQVLEEAEEEELGSLEDSAVSRGWTFINGRSDQAISNQRRKSTTQLTLNPLADELRSAGIKRLRVAIFFEDPQAEVALTGGTRLQTGGKLDINYFHAEVDLNAPTTAVIIFSVGYGATDVLRRTIPLAVFFLLVALLTLWVRRSALRMKEQPDEMWGRYFQFWQLLASLIWLVWIPICAWSGLSEVISFLIGRDRKLTVQILNIGLYLLPPLFALCLSQLLSKPVYDRMLGLEWSPRDVMRKAIAMNAVSLLPLFIVMILIGMLNAGSRFPLLFVIGSAVVWVLASGLINRLFRSSIQAVTAGEFRDRVFELAKKAGTKVNQLYVIPESSSQPSNALARSDNALMITASLLKHLNKREVDSIMAHEIGHLKEKHPHMTGYITLGAIVVTNIVVTALASVANLQRSWPVIFSFAMLGSILILHFISRGYERHADAIAIGLTGDPESFISGLAKLCRLNLMPVNSGSWGESMESHPRTRNRLQDIARVHGISDARFQELLRTPLIATDGYSTLNADAVAGKAFTSDFKKKRYSRVALTVFALLLLLPVVIALLLAQINLPGLWWWLAYPGGAIVAVLLCLLAKNFLSARGYQRPAQLLRNELEKQGFGEAARRGDLVGLAPAAQTQKYENYLFWDAGVLWLTADKLCYIGEESRFALERKRITKVYWRDSRAEWISDRSLFIEWRDSENSKVTNAIYFVRIAGGSILQERRKLVALHARVNEWLERPETFAQSSPQLQSLPEPAFSAITSEPASDRFNFRLVIKSALILSLFNAGLSYAFRLSFASACYSLAVLLLIVLLDELPKILNRSPAEIPTAVDPVPKYASGIWAESNPATTVRSVE